jgi:hypothetical protein
MTCNDEEFLKKWHRGFIWSRCAHKIYCTRPTRKEMEERILPSKIEAIGGKMEWVKPACDFAYDVLKTDDPRAVISMLDGMDRLITGEYQKDYLHIINLQNKALRTEKNNIDQFN